MHEDVCVYMQESVEDMGLYEDVSGAGGTSVQVKVTVFFLFCFLDNEPFETDLACELMRDTSTERSV